MRNDTATGRRAGKRHAAPLRREVAVIDAIDEHPEGPHVLDVDPVRDRLNGSRACAP